MEIEIKKCDDPEEWSSNLTEFNYSLFITPPWVESFTNEKQNSVYLELFLHGESIAKISGLSITSKIAFHKKLLFYAGPAIKRNTPVTMIDPCIRALVTFAKINRYCRLVLLSYDFGYISAYSNEYGFSERSEFIINLLQDKNIINGNISRNFKRSVGKAIKQGYEVKETESSTMADHLVQLMQETKRIRLYKGYSDYNYFYFPGFNRTSLDNLIKEKAVHFYYIEKDEKILAVQAIMQYNQKAYALFIGINEDGYKNGVPSFIDYTVALMLKAKSYEYLNYGGVPTDKTHLGIAHFKKSMGAYEVHSSYGSTNFLIFPHYLLNPLIKRIRKYHSNYLVNILKRTFDL
jgi:hypothetical protein